MRYSAPAMRRRSLGSLALAVAALASCSSTTTGSGEGASSACVKPSSSYVVHFVEKSGGTCGAIPDAVVNTTASGEFEAQPGCTGSRTVDGCDVLLTDYVCTASNGVVTKTTGEVKWASDGASGEGTVQISVTGAGIAKSCTSSYVVTYTRQ